jgi:hypothetical protein
MLQASLARSRAPRMADSLTLGLAYPVTGGFHVAKTELPFCPGGNF